MSMIKTSTNKDANIRKMPQGKNDEDMQRFASQSQMETDRNKKLFQKTGNAVKPEPLMGSK